MKSHKTSDLASEHRRVIEQARASIEACKALLREAGLTPETCLERVRHLEGEAAVQQIRGAAAQSLRGFHEQVQRDAMHALPRTASRYAARRGFV